jgi:GxxExxY protein
VNEINKLSYQIIKAAIAVHEELGPGLLESVYSKALAFELSEKKISFERERLLPILYKGHELGDPLVIDMIIDDKLIIELKSVEEVRPVHLKQLLTYLRLTKKELGLLINFNTALLKEGIHRVVNKKPTL